MKIWDNKNLAIHFLDILFFVNLTKPLINISLLCSFLPRNSIGGDSP